MNLDRNRGESNSIGNLRGATCAGSVVAECGDNAVDIVIRPDRSFLYNSFAGHSALWENCPRNQIEGRAIVLAGRLEDRPGLAGI
jgi:hypothetical protein